MKKIVFCVLLITSGYGSFAQNGTEPVKVTDMLRIKSVSSITISNDGKTAAFTVMSIEPDDKSKLDYRYVNQVYAIRLDSASSPTQLTFAKEGASQPSWNPDGTQLAFIRTIEGKPQVFILPMSGGEPVQITKFPYGASSPKWSPDGKKILFSSAIPLKDLVKDSILNPGHELPKWDFEKPGIKNAEYFALSKAKPNPDGNLEEIRAYLLQNEVDNKARVLNKLNIQDESGVTPEISFTHFFIIDAHTGAEAKPLSHGFYRLNSMDFTPDGRHLLLSGQIDSLQHPDRVLENSLYLTDADGSHLHSLAGQKGYSYGPARISPDGRMIVYQYSPVSGVNIPKIGIKVIGSDEKPLAFTVDRPVSNFTWSNDGRYLYFIAQSNGGAPLLRVDVSSPDLDIKQLSDFNSGINSYDITYNKILFSKTQVTNPSDLYVTDSVFSTVMQLSNFNDWVKNKRLSIPEKHSFRNDSGMTVEYWVMKPGNYTVKKKYPLLLEIHGGPSAMWGPGESSMWHEYQYFCSKGYGVVYCNPGGSGGYGEKFLRANINNWGTGPTADVLSALDKTVAEGWADTSKLLITGGSYAGYLVAWIIGHDHRFKAACSQRGVYDLSTFFGEGNAWRLVPNYFGGYPWQPEIKQVLDRESPITYVENITTPYIIFHGDNDRRTGFVQGEMLYRSLKVLGRPVEYVRHPGGTHELTRSGDNRQRMDQMLRTYEFFERWLKK
jgi:dipeptidyl aminopeptidase/acylaminoacyl peptidase